jgi:hypothetical protein
MASWPEGREYLEQQRRRLPRNKFKRLHLKLQTSSEGYSKNPMLTEACDRHICYGPLALASPFWGMRPQPSCARP